MKMTTMKQLLPQRNAQLIERGTLWKEKCSDGHHPPHINVHINTDKRKILGVNVTAEW